MDKSFRKKISFITGCALVVLISVTVNGSYAFYSAFVSEDNGNNRRTSVSTETIRDTVLTGNTNVSSSTFIPGDYVTNSFTVTNQSDVATTYTLYWTNVTNTFVNTNDLEVLLSYTVNNVEHTVITSSDNVRFPTASNTNLATNITIPANTSQVFTLRVTYLNTASNQISDEELIFGGSIGIKQ